jgi:SSS family solute:Na+ symporter
MVANLLPTGVTGLVLAGLVAAIMSSIDSALNSSSTLVVLDFVKAKRPNLTDTETARYGRIATLVFMVIAAVVAPLIAYAGGLFKYIQEAFSYIVPPVVAIFIVGLFWARGNGKGALRTLIVGHSVSAIIFLVTKLGYITIHYTIVAGLNTIFCAFLFYAFSMAATAPPIEKVKGLTWQYRPVGASTATDLAWYKDYRVHSAILLALTACLVIAFW